MINRPVEEPDQSLMLKLTAHEINMLTWLSQKARLHSPAELVEGFIADFTGSWRTNGACVAERVQAERFVYFQL